MASAGQPPPDKLEKILFQGPRGRQRSKVVPDWLIVDTELSRKGMTRQLMWQEYLAEVGTQAMSYSQFCRSHRVWKKSQRRSMHQLHKAGEKLFIDFCGPTVPIINRDTGQMRRAAIFVAVMGASNYTYIDACEGQDMASWLPGLMPTAVAYTFSMAYLSCLSPIT
jgi:transposase